MSLHIDFIPLFFNALIGVLNLQRCKHIQENHHHNNNNNNNILTIKHANKGRDVRLGIDDNDTLQSVKEFLLNNKNDFDDLRDCEDCITEKEKRSFVVLMLGLVKMWIT